LEENLQDFPKIISKTCHSEKERVFHSLSNGYILRQNYQRRKKDPTVFIKGTEFENTIRTLI